MRVLTSENEKIMKIYKKKVITRKDLVLLLYKTVGMSLNKTEIDKLLLNLFDLIYELLFERKKIIIRGFATFENKLLKATKREKPINKYNKNQQDNLIHIPNRRKIKITPSKSRNMQLKDKENINDK